MEKENQTNEGYEKQRMNALILRAVAVGLLLLATLVTLFVPFTQIGYGKYTEEKIRAWESMTKEEQSDYLEGMTGDQQKEYLQSMYGTSFSLFDMLLDLPGEIQYMVDSAKYTSDKTANPPQIPENGHGFTDAVDVYTQYIAYTNMEDLVTEGNLSITTRSSQIAGLLLAMAIPFVITLLVLIMTIVLAIKTVLLFTNKAKVLTKSVQFRSGLAMFVCQAIVFFIGLRMEDMPLSVSIPVCLICLVLDIAVFVLGILYNKRVKALTADVYKQAAQN